MRSAASTCETPSGSRHSFRSISPGCVGARCVGSIERSSVVVRAGDVISILAFKREDDAILLVHANRMIARAIGSKSVKPITGRHTKILELRDGIDLIELPPNDWP